MSSYSTNLTERKQQQQTHNGNKTSVLAKFWFMHYENFITLKNVNAL